jgi:hypothetical protein
MITLSGWHVRALADGRVIAMLVVDTDTRLAGIDVDRNTLGYIISSYLLDRRWAHA